MTGAVRRPVHDAEGFTGPVAPERQARGVWLSRAWEAFGGSAATKVGDATMRFAASRDGETPEAIIEAHGLNGRDIRKVRDLLRNQVRETEILLTYGKEHRDELAASHRAAKQALTAWGDYLAAHTLAKMEVLNRLSQGSLTAFGYRDLGAEHPLWIPVHAWHYLTPDAKERDVVRGEGITYWRVRVVDPRAVEAAPTLEVPPSSYRTGTPGAPSSKKLVEGEMHARAQRGELKSSFHAEAVELESWRAKHHPNAPKLKAKTIQNDKPLKSLFGELAKDKELRGAKRLLSSSPDIPD